MKWVFRIFGLIISLFVIGGVVGYFFSPSVNVERSEDMFVLTEDIFPYISDLETHALWSPWHSDAVDYTVGGSRTGVGQMAIWDCRSKDCEIGSEEIAIVQYPEFVNTELVLGGRKLQVTYALMGDMNSDGSLTVLFKAETEVGGFPFIQRLVKFREKAKLEARLDDSLTRLEALLVADGMAE